MEIPAWSGDAKQLLSQMGDYRDSRGNTCKLVCLARHSETYEEVVVYGIEGKFFIQRLPELLEKGIAPERKVDIASVEPGAYEHFKGFACPVLGTAYFGNREHVIYSHDGNAWVRPADMFLETVAGGPPRFRRIS